MRPFEWVQRLQLVDRRLVYLALAIVLAIPFLVEFSLPIYPDRYSRQTYEAIDAITRDPATRDKVVLIVSNWGPASEGENGPQLQVVVQHLLRRGVRFLLCSTGDPTAWSAAEARLEKSLGAEVRRAVARGEPPPRFDYGEHYLKLGMNYSTVFEPIAKSLVLDTRAFFRTDAVRKLPLTDENFPLLRHFRGVEDIALVYVVSAADEGRSICGIVQRQVPGLKVATATMGITANDMYPYMKSGQLCGLLNSARAASEYLSLLDPEAPLTGPIENSMSLGKMFLLLLVVLGNAAYFLTRWAQARQRLRPQPLTGQPMSPLPGGVLWALGISFAAFYAGTVVLELVQYARHDSLPRPRVARVDDIPTGDYPGFERVGRDDLLAEARARLETDDALGLAERADVRADAAWARLVERRIGEFLAALLTLGIFAFLLGENPFYRTTEALMIGSALAFSLLELWDTMLWPRWAQPIATALEPDGNPANLLWLLLLIPGSLWYFVYSKKHRWLNQLVVALFLGLVIGPKFGEQIGLLIPQVVDTIRPVWPFTDDVDVNRARAEHLVFVIVMVLSLTYFIFFLQPKSAPRRGLLTAGRLVMMVGFGAMFGNTVNTRLSWLAPRIGDLLDAWLGNLFAG